MRYPDDMHLLPLLVPEGGYPTCEENSSEKKCENTRCFFLSHNSKVNQQKQRDVVSKSAAKIYPSNKYGVFPVILLLTNHETTCHLPFEQINFRSVIYIGFVNDSFFPQIPVSFYKRITS